MHSRNNDKVGAEETKRDGICECDKFKANKKRQMIYWANSKEYKNEGRELLSRGTRHKTKPT